MAASRRNSNVPTDWPGGFGLYKYSKASVMVNVRSMLIVFAITTLLSSVLDIYSRRNHAYLLQLIIYLINLVFTIALYFILLAGTKNKKMSFADALDKALNLKLYFKVLLLNILTGVILGVSLVLLVIPFFFVLPRVILAPYYLIDKKLEPIEALKAAWNDTGGFSVNIWGVLGVYIAIVVLMVTIIGIPFSLYMLFMYSAARTVTYRFVIANTTTRPTNS